jgi:hypothetical protein
MCNIFKGDTMTINGGSSWAAVSSQSYGKGNVQSQSGASGKADYTSMMQQASDALLSTLDTDKSGTIDKAEFSQAAQALADKTGKSYNDAGTVFNTIDKNNDGSISADELLSALQQSKSKQAHGTHHHHHKMEATDTSAQSAVNANSAAASAQSGSTADSAQASNSSEETASFSKMQMALLQRVMAAYSSNAPASSSTTLATA